MTVCQELVSGRPGGLTSDLETASLERFHAASHLAYWPLSIRWLIASARGLARPLPFFAVAAIRPWRDSPAPEYCPAIFVALGVVAVWVTWYERLGLGPR